MLRSPVVGALGARKRRKTLENEELEKEIEVLINFPVEPKSSWVRQFESSSESAISGAILHWERKLHAIGGGDNVVNKREAALSILNSRLSSNNIKTMEKLDKSAGRVSVVGIILATVGVGIAIVQLYISITANGT
jgi:hypothetical protein